MEDEPHEVVTLLLKRMESHPEEFRIGDGPFHDRWYDHVNGIHAYGSEADKAAIAAGLRKIRLAEIHEKVMDELLNGDERRRKAEEEAEYERNLATQGMLSQRQAQQQALQAAQQKQAQQNAYANQLGQYNQAQALGLAGQHGYAGVANGGTGETLESTLGKLKKLVRR